ncbi:MAG: DUF488 domain-containing protein [Thermoproteota archaeon]|nr:DUF488 domain-containing protein [Thermoproteota archaeon]
MHLFTIGHSTRSFEELLSLLKEHEIQVLVDVRRWPSSKRNPQFNREALEKSLAEKGIKYVWLGEELGGYRRKGLGENSPNKGWSSKGFRNYADHTLTEEFEMGIRKLLSYTEKQRVVYICAELVPWKCHRRIISDYLVVEGHRVTHIVGEGEVREHKLTSFAKFVDGKLLYPKS